MSLTARWKGGERGRERRKDRDERDGAAASSSNNNNNNNNIDRNVNRNDSDDEAWMDDPELWPYLNKRERKKVEAMRRRKEVQEA